MQGMASIRRNTTAIQRDGSVKQFQDFVDNSPSPKISYSRTYLAIRGLLNLFPVSLNFVFASSRLKSQSPNNLLLQRYPRPSDRLKGFKWKRVLFNFVVFFILGIFIGFTPFLSLNIPTQPSDFIFQTENDSINTEQSSKPVRPEVIFLENPETVQNSTETVTEKEDSKENDLKIESPDIYMDLVVRKLLIIVTTTHVRPFQAYYLNRLAHTLSAVPRPVLWIVVDRYYQSMETARILMLTGIMYRHMACTMTATNMRKLINCQRNVALYHIKKHRINGIVYFADDDGVYSVELFEEMRKIKRFGTWPVATYSDSCKKFVLEGPLCNKNKVMGWHSNQKTKAVRRFPIGLSGYAFNSTIIWDNKKWKRRHPKSIIFHSNGKESSQESKFAEHLVDDERQMEGLAGNCSRVLVWRVGFESAQLDYPSDWTLPQNLDSLVPLQ